MKRYHILYYTWHEYTFEDCVESLRYLGHSVDIISGNIQNYDIDEDFMSDFSSHCSANQYDCIFTFNYFPVISRIAKDYHIRYISWVFDSPHLTLDSATLPNECNAVFLFDYCLYEKYCKKGIHTVYYMPLGYNHIRLEKKILGMAPQSIHEITFLGTLYDDQFNFFDQIKYLPEKLSGYMDALIQAQLLVYGYDFFGDLFRHEHCNEMAEYVQLDLGSHFTDYRDELFRNMLRKKATILERRQILSMIGETYPVDLYSPKEPIHIPVNYKGYAEYKNQMPEIFYTSKINLNITLRSILSGIPLRVIDILGSHGFVITNYQSELPNYFKNGEDIVWYGSRDDLMDKIRFYLEHDSERRRIAENGNKIARQLFTYEQLLGKILSACI